MIRLIELLERIVHKHTDNLLGEAKPKNLQAVTKKQSKAAAKAAAKAAKSAEGTRQVGSKKGVKWEPEDVIRSPGKKEPINWQFKGPLAKQAKSAAEREKAREDAESKRAAELQARGERSIEVKPSDKDETPAGAAKRAGKKEKDEGPEIARVRRRRESGKIEPVDVIVPKGKQGMNITASGTGHHESEAQKKLKREKAARAAAKKRMSPEQRRAAVKQKLKDREAIKAAKAELTQWDKEQAAKKLAKAVRGDETPRRKTHLTARVEKDLQTPSGDDTALNVGHEKALRDAKRRAAAAEARRAKKESEGK